MLIQEGVNQYGNTALYMKACSNERKLTKRRVLHNNPDIETSFVQS